MSKRTEAIAQLNTYLEGGEKTQLRTGEETALLAPYEASSETPLTAEVETAPPPPGVSEAQVAKAAAAAGRASYQEKLRAAKEEQRKIDEAKKREEAQRTEAEKATRNALAFGASVLATGQRVWRASKEKLGGIPTPGDIWVPLALLLFFFFVLFPVNGHTRVMWLWMAITGNAAIGGALPTPTEVAPMAQTQPAQSVQSQLVAFSGNSGVAVPSTPQNGQSPIQNYAQLMQSTQQF